MYFYILAATFFLLGILLNVAVRKNIRKLLEEAEKIDNTSDGFLRHIVLKYETCMKAGHEINNLPVFVQKQLDRYTIHGIALKKYNQAISFMAGASPVIGIVGAIYDRTHTIDYLLIGFLAMYVLTGMRKIIDTPGEMKLISNEIIDYFENRLCIAASAESSTKEDVKSSDTAPSGNNSGMNYRNAMLTVEEKQLIDEILREYLG